MTLHHRDREGGIMTEHSTEELRRQLDQAVSKLKAAKAAEREASQRLHDRMCQEGTSPASLSNCRSARSSSPRRPAFRTKETNMAEKKQRKLHKNILIAFNRLRDSGGLLCRQFSSSKDAVEHGGKYIYFTVRDNKPFPTGAGRFLVEEALVKSCSDGLFADTPQSFEAVSPAEFSDFKARYEALPMRVGQMGDLRDQREPA